MKCLIVLLVVFTLGQNSNLIAQPCASGWVTPTRTMTINGCDYIVNFCVDCNPLMGTTIRVMGFTEVDQNCVPSPFLNTSQLLNEITERVLSDKTLLTSFCSGDVLKPCDAPPPSTNLAVTIAENLCWQKETLSNGTVDYRACYWLTAYCSTTWTLCINSQGGVDRFIYHSPEISGDEDDCTDPEPADPPIGQTTGCYRVNTRCD